MKQINQGMDSNKDRRTVNNLNYVLVIIAVLIQIIVQIGFFGQDFRPDEYKSVGIFITNILQSSTTLLSEEIFSRVVIFFFNLFILFALYSINLIERRTLYFALIWPLTIFLFSKLYWEFYVFPFFLVRYDLTKSSELLFIAFLSILFLVTAEGNLLILILYRLTLMGIKLGFKIISPLMVALGGILLNIFFNNFNFNGSNTALVLLERFQWTREIANPEYSIFETIGIFIASMHFFTMHTDLWLLDLFFALTVILLIMSRKHFFKRLKVVRYEIFAFLSVLLAMTEITHAFQNARYYFMFIPILASCTPIRFYPIIALIGLLHVFLKLFEVFLI